MRTSRKPGPLTAAFDRGPARYFHGRKQILHDFKELLVRAAQAKSGTTFLIQGAPGAGKTALLYECEKLARSAKWKTVNIDPNALWEPEILRHSLGRRKTPKVVGGSIRIGTKNIADAELKVEWSQLTILRILQSTRKPLLLKLDEAQTLGTVNAPHPGQDGTAANVLRAIHNGELNHPVLLLVGGLGTTSVAFKELGISRFASGCLVELGSLSEEAEQAVLRDWLTKDGGAKGDPTIWMDAIAQETHGWPQHILSYVKPALNQLHADKRGMTTEGLHVVLEAGRRFRAEYYEHRADDFDKEHRQSLAKLLVDIPLGEGLTGSAIRSSLTKEYGSDEAKKLFRRALHCGVLHKQSGYYAVPIPSMHDWLISKYACT